MRRGSLLAGLLTLALAAPAAAQQRAAPPSPPPVADCWPGPWLVFFGRDSAEIDAQASEVLARIVATDRGGCGPLMLTIVGHADGGERPGVDVRRARSVRAYLRRNHIDSVAAAAMGTRDPRLPIEPGNDEIQNRRVEIFAGPTAIPADGTIAR